MANKVIVTEYPDGGWKRQYHDGSWQRAEVSYAFKDMVMLDITGSLMPEGETYSNRGRYCAEDHKRRYHFRERIVCRDGFNFSLSTALHSYSRPRPCTDPRDDHEAHYRKRIETYSSVELMTWKPTLLDPALERWAEGDSPSSDEEICYAYVPAGVLALVIVSRGGTESKDLPGGVSDAVDFWENHPVDAAEAYKLAQKIGGLPEDHIALKRFHDREDGPPRYCESEDCEYCTNYEKFKEALND